MKDRPEKQTSMHTKKVDMPELEDYKSGAEPVKRVKAKGSFIHKGLAA